ncbi:MAG: LPS translocon maturation chaperone LptM, partial [Steroidobacteraceae bacterium]
MSARTFALRRPPGRDSVPGGVGPRATALRALATLASLAACASLAGCGQRGPLYLAHHNAQIVTRTAAAAASSASSSSSKSS